MLIEKEIFHQLLNRKRQEISLERTGPLGRLSWNEIDPDNLAVGPGSLNSDLEQSA